VRYGQTERSEVRDTGNVKFQRCFNQADAIVQEEKKENCPDVIFLYDNSCVTDAGESTSLIFGSYCSRKGPNMTTYICILPKIIALNVNIGAQK